MNRIAVGFLVWCLFVGSANPQAGQFSLDGENISPRIYSLEGTPGKATAGDVVYVGEYLLVLDGPGPYRFFSDKEGAQGKGLYRANGDGTKTLVAIRVDWDIDGRNRRFVDGSKDLSDLQLLGIRGIKIGWDGKSAWFDKLLRRLDLSKVCVQLYNSDCVKTGDHYTTYINSTKTPEFPPNLQYLWIKDQFGSYRSLANTPELLFFYGSLMDTRWNVFAGKPRLRYLDLSFLDLDESGPTHPRAGAQLVSSDLRTLVLRCATPGSDPDPAPDLVILPSWFLKSLRSLRALDLSQSRGFARLVLLNYPHLTHLDLSGTSGYGLPGVNVPKLKKLNVMSADISPKQIVDLQRLLPGCEIIHDWAKVLRGAIPAPTRLRVRRGSPYSSSWDKPGTLLDLRDPKKVGEFLALIEIDGDRSGGHCMCGGAPTLEFYQGKRLVVALGMHHARGLRWAGGPWIGDATMTTASRDRVLAWLDQHGVSGPLEDLQRQERDAIAEQKAEERWKEGMPRSLRSFWKAGGRADVEAMHAALKRAEPDLHTRIRSLLHWYGCGTGVWSVSPSYESVAMELIYKYSTAQVLASIADTHLTAELKEGTAHFFGCHPFTQRRPHDLRLLPKPLTRVLLQHCLDTGTDFKKSWAKASFGGK